MQARHFLLVLDNTTEQVGYFRPPFRIFLRQFSGQRVPFGQEEIDFVPPSCVTFRISDLLMQTTHVHHKHRRALIQINSLKSNLGLI